MALDLIELTSLLEITDNELSKFRDQIVLRFNDPIEVKEVRDQQCKARGKPNCQSCRSEGECRVLHGVANLILGEAGNAIKNLEFASRFFARKEKTWNSILSMALLSLALAQNGNTRLAINKAQDTISKLENNFLRLHAKDYPEIANHIKEDLRGFISNPPAPPPPAPSPIPPTPDDPQPPEKTFRRANLVFPSMQVFSGVRAGPHGPIWERLPKNRRPRVDRIILDDCSYNLYTVSTGSQISINPDKKYGWVKVEGDSMEASKPVAIHAGDYVMVSESHDADDGSIVIAAFADESSAGYNFVVKRYSKSDGHLISETEPPDKYDHLFIDKNTTILATVIAVAKPAIKQSSPPPRETSSEQRETKTQKKQTPATGVQAPNVTEASNVEMNEDVLMQELIALLGVTGTRVQAERLVKLEQNNAPGIKRHEAIRKAIIHLLHERQ